MDDDTRTRRWAFAAGLLLILLVAAALRLYRLPALPVGLHFDEAANGILAGEIARGAKAPVFIPSYTGKEVLFFYWTALWMKLLGVTPLALRLSAALAGLATVAATAWAVRELLHGRRDADRVALLTAAFLATSFWHLVLSRYGFRAVTQPLMQALTVGALWRGLRLSTLEHRPESAGAGPPDPGTSSKPPSRGRLGSGIWRSLQSKAGNGIPAHRPGRAGAGLSPDPGTSSKPPSRGHLARGPTRSWRTGGLPWLLLAGLCCGLTAYTYLAARAFPVPLAAALVALLIADRANRRARLIQLAVFVAVAALTLAPLAHYWLTHPGSFLTRTQQVASATWSEAWHGLRACLGMLFLRGDPYIRFNIPNRPLFDPITAALSILGLIAVIANCKSQIANCKSANRKSAKPSANTTHPVTLSPCHLVSCAFLLTTLPIMLLPSALATGEITPSNLRTAGLIPFIYVFPAIAISNLQSQIADCKLQIADRKSQMANLQITNLQTRPPTLVICHLSFVILILSVLTPLTALAYFRDWAPSPALYEAADGDLADAAAYLNQTDGSTELAEVLASTTAYVASNHYQHPTLAFLADDYGAIRSIRGGRTVVFSAEGKGLLIVPRSTSKGLDWVQSLLGARSLVAAPPGPDGAPAFHAYRVSTATDLVPTHSLAADLGHVALVTGYDVVGQPRSGGSADVAIWYRVLATPGQGDYRPVGRLVDRQGFTWGEKLPFHYPSGEWTAGELIVDLLEVPAGPGAPPGDYRVRFSLYSEGAGAALPVLDEGGRYAGSSVELPLRLARAEEPPDLDDLSIRTRLDARVDGLTLLGANLDTKRARPGEPLFLKLFWRADQAPLPDYEIHVTLGDAPLYTGAPGGGSYPTYDWTAGEIVADRYGLRVPLDAPPGKVPLRLHLEDPAAGAGPIPLPDLGTVTVEAAERVFDVPPISHPLTATLGGQVELLGYDLSAEQVAPGDTLTLTLYWRALREMDESYTVFTHLVAPDGALSGQRDNPPLGGTYPTNLWLSGEVVVDTYEIAVAADAGPGEHRLEAGMYVAQTGARLPVDGTEDDAVVLQGVEVSGS